MVGKVIASREPGGAVKGFRIRKYEGGLFSIVENQSSKHTAKLYTLQEALSRFTFCGQPLGKLVWNTNTFKGGEKQEEDPVLNFASQEEDREDAKIRRRQIYGGV